MGALYASPDTGLVNGVLTQSCGLPTTVAGFACGNYSVNTQTPAFQPTSGFAPRLPAQTNPTIGDRLTGAGVDWAWYSGGWSNANGSVGEPGWSNGTAPAPTPTGCSDPNVDPTVAAWPECPDNLFQYHHQPFNYYAPFTTATPEGLANRAAHLRDEQEFIQLANGSTNHCDLPPVSFIKPIGEENEHPGYASEPNGSDHLVSLLQSIEGSTCKENTMVIVTYDEFGGEWDHVPPPGQGNSNGPHDQWGPGTRIPALVLSPHLKGPFVVDSTQYDTTSILATIEQKYGLAAAELPRRRSRTASRTSSTRTRRVIKRRLLRWEEPPRAYVSSAVSMRSSRTAGSRVSAAEPGARFTTSSSAEEPSIRSRPSRRSISSTAPSRPANVV